MTGSKTKNGWVIVAVAMLALIVSNGLAIGGLPPFYKPIREEFVNAGLVAHANSESFIANAANITFLASGIFSLLGGWLITRFSLKPLMIAGCILLGGGLVLHSQALSVEIVYLARLMMGASLGFVGVAPCVVLVSNWFNTGRGTALGTVLMGTSLGGFLIPLIAAPLIANYGWRPAMLGVSALVWLVLLPGIVLLVRESPGIDETPISPDAELSSTPGGLTLGEAVRTPLFWLFALTAAAVFYPIFVTSQQFILYLQSPKIGVSPQTAAFAQSALFAVSLGGKLLAGFLSDRFRPVIVMTACALVMFLASLVLFALTADTALIFLLPFAVGYGGTFVLLQRLAAELFGRRETGKILGLITLIEVIGAAIGGRITGYLADQAGGDYTYAFYGVTVAAGLALMSTLLILSFAKKREIAIDPLTTLDDGNN